MGRLSDESYIPDPDRHATYDLLYREYLTLHDLFGRGGEDVMRRLKRIQLAALASDR